MMERLTRKIGDGVVFPEELVGKSLTPDNEIMYKILHKLAAYEDTGLEPEEIIGLCEMDKRSRMAKMLRWEEADAQGRLVVLPCKLGTKVFCILDKNIREGLVAEYTIRDAGIDGITVRLDSCAQRYWNVKVFGKTVFLAREEADAALRKEQA